MPKHQDTVFENEMKQLLAENGIDNKMLLSEIIDILQSFCQDNILALAPLTQTEQKNPAVQERILYFSMISKLLGGIEALSQADVVFTLNNDKTKKKKASKKKHKKEKRD